MQHAALDSVANSPQLTGTSFPSVSPSSNPPNQYEANPKQRSPALTGLGAFMDLCFVAARDYRRIGLPALCDASNTYFREEEVVRFLDKKFHLNPRRRYQPVERCPWLMGIGERLWLMPEVRRGLRV